MDKLPSAVIVRGTEHRETRKNYDDGIPIGKLDETGDIVLFNHFNLIIKTQPVPESKNMRIVGFEVEPRSYWPG